MESQQNWNDLRAGYTRLFGPPSSAMVIDIRDPERLTDLGDPGKGLADFLKFLFAGSLTGDLARFSGEKGRQDPSTRAHWERQDQRDQALAAATRPRKDRYLAAGGDQAAANVQAQAQNQLSGAPQDAVGGVQALLQNHEGIAIGDSHEAPPVWSFLIGNLPALQASGLNTIYLESIRDDSYQGMVDEYFSTPGSPMSPALLQMVVRYDGAHHITGAGLQVLLERARTAGVRIRGIDGRPARKGGSDAAGLYQRAVMMNTYAAQAIENDAAARGGGKYLVELGRNHTGRMTTASPWYQPRQTVRVANVELPKSFPGLDQLLGIPAVSFSDRQDPNSALRTSQGSGVVQGAP